MLLRLLFFVFLLLLSLTALADKHEIKVGVLAFRGTEKAMQRWQATFDYLSQTIPGTQFNILPMSLSELDNAVINQSIDFVITNPGQYVRIGSKYGMSWLATLKSHRHKQRKLVIGSALVVRADSTYNDLNDLKGEHLGAVDPLAFGGFQVFWGEMAKQGRNPKRFFSRVDFSHYPVDALIYWVRDNMVKGAIVPACLLEKMHGEGLINIRNYRVLNIQHHPGFNCLSSSQLYPNWSFAKLRDTPPLLAEKIAKVLLSMNADSKPAIAAGAMGWTAPVSTYEIHQLYKRLNIHPWQQAWWQEAWRWIIVHWPWGLLILFIILIGFLHHLWVQVLVNRRTHELELANSELQQQQQQLEHAQRIAILGELSSDLAHELNQPLAAINSYADGATIRLRKEQDNQNFISLFEKISAEAQRSAKIIQRIRGFARKEDPQKQLVQLDQLIDETLALLQFELKKSEIKFEHVSTEKINIVIDPIGIQQVLINLIRNSMESLSQRGGTRIIQLKTQILDHNFIQISLIDNGSGMEKSMQDKLFQPFVSSKQQGLGLGLSICKRIVENHQGQIWSDTTFSTGCKISFTLSGRHNE